MNIVNNDAAVDRSLEKLFHIGVGFLRTATHQAVVIPDLRLPFADDADF